MSTLPPNDSLFPYKGFEIFCALSLVFGSLLAFFFSYRTFILIDFLALIGIIGAILLLLFHYILVIYRKVKLRMPYVFCFMSLLCFAPLVAALFLSLNFVFAHNKHLESVPITIMIKTVNGDEALAIVSSEPRFKTFPYLLNFDGYKMNLSANIAELKIAQGLFGFDIIEGKQLVTQLKPEFETLQESKY